MHAFLLAAGDKNWIVDPHGFGLVFWTGLIFAVVALILYKIAWGPLLQALVDREDAITGEIRRAEETRAEADALRKQYEDQLEKVRQEAQSIIDEGEADGRRIVAEAQAKATQEAADVRARADRDIQLAKQKAVAELKTEASKLGLAIAEKVLKAEIDAKRHQGIIDDVLASYGS